MKKVVLYINQFYGGIGGEEKANTPPRILEGTVGPGAALKGLLKNGQITHTVICGDDFMNEHGDEAITAIDGFLKGIDFDLLIAGPAFFAGRYGVNCGHVCQHVQNNFRIPTVTSMYEEAPGVEMYRKDTYILRGGNSAAHMRKDLAKVAQFADKLLGGQPLLWADAEGYFPRGLRYQINLPEDRTSANRAVEMLLKKLRGEPYETELPVEVLDPIPVPPAIKDMKKARIALISTGGIVPMGNPDRISSAGATRFAAYDLPEKEMKAGEWESIHGGYDHAYANANPMTHIPVDALRRLEQEGKVGYLHPKFYVTTGNLTSMKDARRMAHEIAELLRQDNIQAVVLGSA